MEEYFTEALVLDKEPIGEADSLVTLYTKELGKITARAISVRKITSKLASHLEPLNFVNARLVHKNRFQVVDALKTDRLNPDALGTLHLIKDISGEGEPDLDLWNLLKKGNFEGKLILATLGFDSQFACCSYCGVNHPSHFLTGDLEYSCQACFVRAGSPTNFVLE